ncbi:MAG TPA: hypothetical protein VK598_05135 [Nitrospiraceae bacterium]|nr:hypothetical protein [Nitrospiraceae bacterium]
MRKRSTATGELPTLIPRCGRQCRGWAAERTSFPRIPIDRLQCLQLGL